LRNVFSIPGVDTDVWRINTKGQSFTLCGNCYNWYPKGTGKLKKFTDDEGKKHPICGKCGKHDNWVGHFASFTPDFVRPMIAIATSERGCCPTCGKNWARVMSSTQRELEPQRKCLGIGPKSPKYGCTIEGTGLHQIATSQTLGWMPTCACYPPQADLKAYDDLPTMPAIVLDCFGGSGTVGLVAKRMGRNYILIEINPNYCEMATKRIGEDNLFTKT